jgi:hypothetical protein
VGSGVMTSCHAGPTGARTTEPAAQTSDTAAAAEAKAVRALHAWLDDSEPGTLTLSSITTDAAQKLVTSRQVAGRFDPFASVASLTGTLNVLGSGSTVQDPLNVIMLNGKLYWSIPTKEQPLYPGRGWFESDLAAAQAAHSEHSIWWIALSALDKVHMDGLSEVDTKTAVEYTGTVDLAQLPAAAAQLNKSPIIATAGTTKVSVDLYTALGTGDLVRITYRLGLQVSVDATPTATSSAGYEVDVSGLDTPAKGTPTPILEPPPSMVAVGGTGDLSQLMLF